MEQLELAHIAGVAGTVKLPGSKSLSNRALLLAALSSGTTQLHNVLRSDDTERMLEALQQLGVSLKVEGTDVTVKGLSGGFSTLKEQTLFLGNAGTAMRPLCAALAFSQGTFTLTGEPRMYERPIGPLTSALQNLGINVEYLNSDGYPPVCIHGGKPTGHSIRISGSTSSQFITALLMAAPLAGGLTIHVEGDLISKPYVDMTIRLMQRFGVEVQRESYSVFTVGAQGYVSPGHFLVEGDASAATYFLAAGAIAGDVVIEGCGEHSVQGDAGFVKVLQSMGADITVQADRISVKKSCLHGIDIDMNDMPDAAMTLVPLALFTDGPVTVRNIASWRVKETDRLAAMAKEMSKLGVRVTQGADFISVDASVRNHDKVCFDTYNDHRMAMALSLVAFDRPVVINDPACVRKTFPEYFKVLQGLSRSA